MTDYEKLSIFTAGLSALISIIAIIITIITYRFSSLSSRRTHSIELFSMWKNVNEIDKNNLITVDMITAIHALDFTAIYYKYKILDRVIIKSLYKHAYIKMYDKLITLDEIIPGTTTNCKESISDTVKWLYNIFNDERSR
jgi:hypothetical protein